MKPIQLMTKILPITEYYVRSSFGVSKECYGRREEKLEGVGRGNAVLVNTCRD